MLACHGAAPTQKLLLPHPLGIWCHTLQAALRLYRSLARGPASLELESRLLGELDALWQDGRQQCPGVSLWGHACTLPLHDAQVGWLTAG